MFRMRRKGEVERRDLYAQPWGVVNGIVLC